MRANQNMKVALSGERSNELSALLISAIDIKCIDLRRREEAGLMTEGEARDATRALRYVSAQLAMEQEESGGHTALATRFRRQ